MKILITEQQLEIIKNNDGNDDYMAKMTNEYKKMNMQCVGLLKKIFFSNLFDLIEEESTVTNYKVMIERMTKLNDKYDNFIIDLEDHDEYTTLSNLRNKNSKLLDYMEDVLRKLEGIVDLDRTPKIIKLFSNDNTIRI